MVTDQQVRRLFMLINKEKSKTTAAVKSGMDPKTALKYRKSGQLPSQTKQRHTWQTRPDPFNDDWAEIESMFSLSPGLEAKTVFSYLQRENPGKYQDGQLRTLQRRIKHWRATEGPPKEIYFPQVHTPGKLSASDFTHMNKLEITINGTPFDHLLYHFVLTYSNWETVSICFSESFESLSTGLQNALWDLGGVPKSHRTDRMSSAVNKDCNPEKFTQRYQALMRHYGMAPERINARAANENGDVEQSHHRFKRTVEQALLLRGSRDFKNQQDYEVFLRKILEQQNAGRQVRLKEELDILMRLPAKRTNDYESLTIRVTPSSTIRVLNNVYSLHSRLIGERIQVRLYIEHLEVWYAGQRIECLPRLRGRGNHKIHYRHIIDWLVRKPGAFANYRYKTDLYPSSYFRIAYDELKNSKPLRADKEYLHILKIAATEGEDLVEKAIRSLLSQSIPMTADAIRHHLENYPKIKPLTAVTVDCVHLKDYDALLGNCQEVLAHG